MDGPQKKIIIVGAGIMGASVAYHLADHGHKATLFDPDGVAPGASGKAGGFLARDWGRGAQRELARASFALHEKLAREFGSAVGYRRLDAFSLGLTASSPSPASSSSTSSSTSYTSSYSSSASASSSGRLPPPPPPPPPPPDYSASPALAHTPQLSWLDGRARPTGRAARVGTTSNCMQVTPRLLTDALLRSARSRLGSEVVRARVTGARRAGRQWELRVERTSSSSSSSGGGGGGSSSSSSSSGSSPGAKVWTVRADLVALCLGPWSNTALAWFPSLPSISAVKGVSLVTPVRVPATALFTQFRPLRGDMREPEAYPRDNELYVCQRASATHGGVRGVPPRASQIRPAARDTAELVEFACAISANAEHAIVHRHRFRAQACVLPVAPDDAPVIGPVPGADGVFVATGHACWGILNAPATGKAIAEMMVLGRSSVDVRAFDPRRFL